jgi:hypothetical protein
MLALTAPYAAYTDRILNIRATGDIVSRALRPAAQWRSLARCRPPSRRSSRRGTLGNTAAVFPRSVSR